jgi:predicted nucleotidyltransferase
MLVSESEGNKKIFKANTLHPLFSDLNNIIRKYVGIDSIVEYVAKQLGELKSVFLTGSFANGTDSGTIDLVFIGNINEEFLKELCVKVGKKINKKIQYVILENKPAFDKLCLESQGKFLLLWEK